MSHLCLLKVTPDKALLMHVKLVCAACSRSGKKKKKKREGVFKTKTCSTGRLTIASLPRFTGHHSGALKSAGEEKDGVV